MGLHGNNKQLIDACIVGNTQQIEKLLGCAELDVNVPDELGRTGLFIACARAHVKIVRLLLDDHRTDPNKADLEQFAPIHEAARSGHSDILKLLLRHGADVDARGQKAVTPLYCAATVGHVNAMEVLLESKANPSLPNTEGRTPLHIACLNGRVLSVNTLLATSEVPHVDGADKKGTTPLYLAAHNNHVSIIQSLLERKANAKTGAMDGYTPLHIASKRGHHESVRVLIPHSEINSKTKYGSTPILLACYGGHDTCVTVLLEASADALIKNTAGYDALTRAAMKGNVNCVKVLIGNGITVDWESELSAYSLAKKYCQQDVLDLLDDFKVHPYKYLPPPVPKPRPKKPVKPVHYVIPEPETETLTLLLTKDHPTVACPVFGTAFKYLQHMQLSSQYFIPNYDRCFCQACHLMRGDNLYYDRGHPPKKYGLPIGWCKFGLRMYPNARAEGALDKWHVAFHGTSASRVPDILRTGTLLIPGDFTHEGKEINPLPGHLDPGIPDRAPPKGVDVSKVFLSPSIWYSGRDEYAPCTKWVDPRDKLEMNIRTAFQVRIEPGTYEVGPQTVGAKKPIDPIFLNSELEWSTKRRAVAVMVGLLLKIEDVDENPRLSLMARIAKGEPALMQSISKAGITFQNRQFNLLSDFTSVSITGKPFTLKIGERIEVVQLVDSSHVKAISPSVDAAFLIPHSLLDKSPTDNPQSTVCSLS